MSLTLAEIGTQGMGSTCRVQSFARINITYDNSYPTGGYTGFSALVKTAISNSGITITDVRQSEAGSGYKVYWDRSADTLVVHQYPTSQGPTTQLADGSSALNGLSDEFVVYWV